MYMDIPIELITMSMAPIVVSEISRLIACGRASVKPNKEADKGMNFKYMLNRLILSSMDL